jgi:autotransporter-associated beta strand protein
LIAGMAPSSSAGNFSLNTGGRTVNELTAGDSLVISPTSGTDTGINYITCGNGSSAGSSVVYTLTGFTAGYTLTNITVYGGWKDAGRDQQAYTVSYSKVTAPATFISLGTVNYNPANPASVQSATRATLTAANGVLATNVAAVKFDFTTPTSENGYVGYAEIILAGMPSPQPVKWAVGNGNWDNGTLNWKSLVTAGTTSFLENNLTALDDSATGSSPITLTLTGNHSPTILTNNSTKSYILAGNFGVTNGSLVKNGISTLMFDNAGANNFTGIQINNGTVQVGNNDTNGSLGRANVTNNSVLAFNRADIVAISNLISGTGSLIQNGTGMVGLSATNSYTGNTTINAGTLALMEPGSISTSALISITNSATLDVTGRTDQTLYLISGKALKGSGSLKGNLLAQAGSTLNPGDAIGTLIVQSNVVLNGVLVMELNRTNLPASDELVSVGGIITAGGTLLVTNSGPTLQAGDVFQLFNQPVSGFTTTNLPDVGTNGWANNLANNGTLVVVSTSSPSLITQVAGNLLTLTWPTDHIGWRLQVQTNSLDQGLGTNWFEVTGSTITNQSLVPIDTANGGAFYRLVYP